MNEELKRRIQESLSKLKASEEDPRLLILGSTGVGKSSLINALIGKKVNAVNTVASTTRSFQTSLIELDDGGRLTITDSPGYGEIGHDLEYSRQVVQEAKAAHAVVLVLKADEKGYERDLTVLGKAASDPGLSIEKPIIIALNQVDKIKPSKEWKPPYNIYGEPSGDIGDKARNIREKIELVRSQFSGVLKGRKCVVVATMADEEEGCTFGIDRFKRDLYGALPEVAKFRYAAIAKLAAEDMEREANVVIKAAAAAAAAAVLINPVPASDFVVLMPLQITMIAKVGAIYGRRLDADASYETLMAMGAGFGARTVFQGVISLVPGLKNILGPPYAAAATHGLGVVAKSYFGTGLLPDQKEIERELKQFSEPEG